MNTHAYTPMHIQDLINRTAMEANTLPLTSRCDSACIFCSHQNNPPQVQVLSVGERSLADILDTMQYLDPARTITIGESCNKHYRRRTDLSQRFSECSSDFTPAFSTNTCQHHNERTSSDKSAHRPIKQTDACVY